MEAPQPQPYEDKCNKHLQQTFNKKWEETNMKKKVLSALLTTAMLASMLVGCGNSNDAPAVASSEAAPAASTEAAASTGRQNGWDYRFPMSTSEKRLTEILPRPIV